VLDRRTYDYSDRQRPYVVVESNPNNRRDCDVRRAVGHNFDYLTLRDIWQRVAERGNGHQMNKQHLEDNCACVTPDDMTGWKKYRLQAFGPDHEAETVPYVIEAPSPGAAVELFLAVHGMLNYHIIELCQVDDLPADENRADVLAIAPDIETRANNLDIWHTWITIENPAT